MRRENRETSGKSRDPRRCRERGEKGEGERKGEEREELGKKKRERGGGREPPPREKGKEEEGSGRKRRRTGGKEVRTREWGPARATRWAGEEKE